MGLLDDAIREHLELKRRRGADPTEVERLEREALGPVRRGSQDAGDVVMDEHQPAAGLAYPEDEVGDEWAEPAEDEQPFDYRAEPGLEREAEPPRHHEIAEEWDAHEPLDLQELDEASHERQALHGESPGLEDAHAPAKPPPAPSAPPPGETPPPVPAPDQSGHLGEETVEYDVEAEHLRQGEGDDVLEETPEFLQDTPDHDRLWFEQRPPRDFDFDG